MRATLCIDDAVGERRRALLNPLGQPFRLEIERWSERGKRARLDEVWWGRVKARLPGGRGWFVDLGLAQDGVIEPTKAQAIVEGALLALRVKSEAYSDKGPTLSLADIAKDVAKPGGSAFHKAPEDDPFLRGVEVVATVREQAARKEVDAAIEEAGQRVVAIPGGGDIAVDYTRAMTTIDVDAASRGGPPDGDAFALELNVAAAEEAARQIGLRGVAGLLVVDFLKLKDKRGQRFIIEAFQNSLAKWLGRSSEVLPLSMLGVCECAIARRQRPLRDALNAPAAEREALDALREIESVGWSARGARIQARVSRAALDWLEVDSIGWKAELGNRLGQRWALQAEDGAAGRPKVWSES